jgi:transposase
VAAPSRLLRGSGDRIKNDTRDARTLAVQLRAGLITPIWVPDAQNEAIRDLARARGAAVRDRTRQRQRLQSFLLRQRRPYSGRSSWTRAHRQWLASQRFEHPAHTLVMQEALEAIRQAEDRAARLTRQMLELAKDWHLAPLAQALQALRGINEVGATILAAELGDPRRFPGAPGFVSYVGLVPGEWSTGERRRSGHITKTGNSEARRVLIEAAWAYRHPARVGPQHEARMSALPAAVREIGWKAQTRLCRRYRSLVAGGKGSTVATTAVAREMAGFAWDIGNAAFAER